MADQTDNVGILTGGKLQQIGASDRLTLTGGLKVSAGTVDLTGATLTGVATTAIADGTASVQMDGSGNMTETSLVSANLTPSGALTLRGGGASQFGDDVGYFAFDGAGALSLSGLTALSLIPGVSSTWGTSGNSAGTLTATFESLNAGAGAGNVAITAKSSYALSDTTSTITSTAGVVTESGLVSIDISPSGILNFRGGSTSTFGDDVGYFSFDGAGALTEAAITSIDLTPSGALTLRGGGASQFGDDTAYWVFDGSGALALTSATTVAITGSGAVTVTGPDNTAAAIALKGGDATARLTVNTLNGAEAVEINAALHLVPVNGSGAITQAGTAGEALAIGDVVTISGTAGKVFQADGNHATEERQDPIGVCTLAASGDAEVVRYAIGGIATTTFDGNVETSDIGKRCYLSNTVKAASLTAPTGSGVEVWMLGKVVACPGGAALAQVLIRPQFLYTAAL